METSKLRKFAQFARRSLIEQVTGKLELVLAANSTARRENAGAVKNLEAQIKLHGQEQVIEKVAYVWFNRFCALRFMDVNRYTRIGVVSPVPGQFMPEILAEAKMGHIDEEMLSDKIRQQILGLLDGKAPSRDPQSEAYRLLVVAACNFWNHQMPFLFEKIADYTELLMPDDLLSGNSILAYTREAMTPDACKDLKTEEPIVEVIGWLYQFYISEKKDQVMARKSAVPTEDIPAVTQLFTPHWIVRYLVENSLGRLWLLNRPNSQLRKEMPYYIEGEAETDFLKIAKPEDIRLLDPACGSGHMLTYAYDLLYAIYKEEGYDAPEIPELILRHNLYGVEICDRAAALAAFALCMKARGSDNRFFRRVVQPKVISLQDVHFAEGELREYIHALNLGDLFSQPVLKLMYQFEEATNFGSLIQPCLDEAGITELRRVIEAKGLGDQLFLHKTHIKVLRILEQAEALTQRYHVVLGNPPYMGNKNLNANLKAFLSHSLGEYKSDLYSACTARFLRLSLPNGLVGLMTPFTWMFIQSYEPLRRLLCGQSRIASLIRPEYHAFFESAYVPVCAFVAHCSSTCSIPGTFIDLGEFYGENIQSEKAIEAITNPDCKWRYRCSAQDFNAVPGCPIAYWLSDKIRNHFTNDNTLKRLAPPKHGMSTGNNDYYLKLWSEVSYFSMELNAVDAASCISSGKTWFPYNKGGGFLKWYGFREYVINYKNYGESLKQGLKDGSNTGARILNERDFFKESITWGDVTSGPSSFRYCPVGAIFDGRGSSAFPQHNLSMVLGFLNSNVTKAFLAALNPTLTTTINDLEKLPILQPLSSSVYVEECIRLARANWDNFETSWDFRDQPLLRPGLKGTTLETSWRNWEAQSTAAIRRMQELETENNRLFIAAYGLEGELQPEVPEEQITLARADASRDMAAFISYAVGCMFGRYALEKPGLILANQGETLADFIRKVCSGKCVVDSEGENNGDCPQLQRADSLAEGDGSGGVGVSGDQAVSQGRTLRADESDSTVGGFHSFEHSGGAGQKIDGGVSEFLVHCERFKSRNGNSNPACPALELCNERYSATNSKPLGGSKQATERTDEPPQITTHCPLSTIHFLPDADNVIPMLDGDWFTDDITERFHRFLRVTFGEENFEANLKFIETALGKNGKKREIRDYFLKDFYNDHVKRYKKRPIYWLFSSPKGSFNALIYMHRYRPDTVSVVLNDYLREFHTKLASRKNHLEAVSISTSASQGEKTKAVKEIEALKKMIAELDAYEHDTLYRLATKQIEIDLDDGVKHNYLQFGAALKKITGLEAKDDE